MATRADDRDMEQQVMAYGRRLQRPFSAREVEREFGAFAPGAGRALRRLAKSGRIGRFAAGPKTRYVARECLRVTVGELVFLVTKRWFICEMTPERGPHVVEWNDGDSPTPAPRE